VAGGVTVAEPPLVGSLETLPDEEPAPPAVGPAEPPPEGTLPPAEGSPPDEPAEGPPPLVAGPEVERGGRLPMERSTFGAALLSLVGPGVLGPDGTFLLLPPFRLLCSDSPR
jgi:hypothetical protein